MIFTFDFSGTLTRYPTVFVPMIQALRAAGHGVFMVTGVRANNDGVPDGDESDAREAFIRAHNLIMPILYCRGDHATNPSLPSKIKQLIDLHDDAHWDDNPAVCKLAHNHGIAAFITGPNGWKQVD